MQLLNGDIYPLAVALAQPKVVPAMLQNISTFELIEICRDSPEPVPMFASARAKIGPHVAS